MPYRNPEKQRDYHRDYARLRRAPTGVCQTPGQTQLPPEFRLKAARDVLELVAEQVNAVRAEAEAGTLEKARCLGYLATIALRAVEVAELADRVDAMERALKDRKENPQSDNGWPANTQEAQSDHATSQMATHAASTQLI
jgi:hypothetical protein